MNAYLHGTYVLGALSGPSYAARLGKRPLAASIAREVIAEVVRTGGASRALKRELVAIDQSIARSGRATLPDGAARVLVETVEKATSGGEEVLGAEIDYGSVIEATAAWEPATIADARRVLEAMLRLLDACKRIVDVAGGTGVSMLLSLPAADQFERKKQGVAGTLAALAALEKQGVKAVPTETIRGVMVDAMQLCLQTIKATDDESAKQALATLVDFLTAIPRRALEPLSTAAKWAIGGAVVLGLALIYGLYRVVASPAGRSVTRHYLGSGR